MIKPINVDSAKAFTLYEACPEARCRDTLNAPASWCPPPQCTKCKGTGGRVTPFASAADLAQYAANPRAW